MKSDKKFKEKYYLLMDYLEEKLPNTKATGNLIKIFMGNYEIKDNDKANKKLLMALTVDELVDKKD